MALPCPALEGRHEGKPGFHVSSTFLDWNSKEMVWTRTESFREAKGKGSSSLSPTAVILNAMWHLPRDIRSGLLASPCLTPHSLSLSSKHFPFVLVHGGDHQWSGLWALESEHLGSNSGFISSFTSLCLGFIC